MLLALEAWTGRPGVALDLGCGAGRDTRALLGLGWKVHAVDSEPEALARLAEHVPAAHRDRLTPMLGKFEELQLPVVDLINASFSLPFCPPARFASLWKSLFAALNPGGIFVGQLFGDRDSWAESPYMTFHTRAEVEALLDPWQLIGLEECEEDGAPKVGPIKHWHVFHIVARRV
jgi:SAM-dependent methyltransferase